jgi:acyl carrier protein
MNEIRERLTNCFLAVFPNLAPENVEAASSTTVGEWDSLAMLSLITVIQEEFGTSLPLDDLEKLQAFESICKYLEEHPGSVRK